MKYQNIKNQISKLKKSPLFYLFLSSKELFHTNFWAWLFEIHKLEAIKIFADSSHTNIETPIREYKKNYKPNSGKKIKGQQKDKSKDISSVIDLFIKTKELEIVVENKVKDFPTIEQLERIIRSFTGEPVGSFVLVCLFNTDHLKLNESEFEGKKWNVLSYGELANKIIPANFSKSPFDNEINENESLGKLNPKSNYYELLIQDYKNFIQNLHELASDDSLKVTNQYDFAIEFNKGKGELFEFLNSINFWEVYQKMRASHLKYEYEKRFKTEFLYKVEYGINHQKATINFPIIFDSTSINGKTLEIGIQLENNQYRRYISCGDAEKMFIRLSKEGVFIDRSIKHKKEKVDFLNYGKNWKYQYALIQNNKHEIDFQKLFGKINEELSVLHDKHDKIVDWFNQEYP
jgi:hypothetical protein